MSFSHEFSLLHSFLAKTPHNLVIIHPFYRGLVQDGLRSIKRAEFLFELSLSQEVCVFPLRIVHIVQFSGCETIFIDVLVCIEDLFENVLEVTLRRWLLKLNLWLGLRSLSIQVLSLDS